MTIYSWCGYGSAMKIGLLYLRILRRRIERKLKMEKISLDLEEVKELWMQLGCGEHYQHDLLT
jgi:hypothetical protein